MAKSKVVTKATKSNKAPAAQTYCFKCQEMTDTANAEVIKLYQTGRLLRKGNCSVCGTSVSGIAKTGTPFDRSQTKKEYTDAQDKKAKKKDDFLAKKAAPKVKTEPVATTVKKKANPTKASQKKLVEVERPVLKRKDGESKKEWNARTDRVWEKRKAEAVA